MRSLLVLVVALSLSTVALTSSRLGPLRSGSVSTNSFDYRPGDEWGGTCTSGTSQSPINFDSDFVRRGRSSLGRLEIGTFGTASRHVVYFTGESIRVNFTTLSQDMDVRIPANEYTGPGSGGSGGGGDDDDDDDDDDEGPDMLRVDLVQMHYHTVSEHTIDGAHAPGELHIVTRVRDGESATCDALESGCLAVFGIRTHFALDGRQSNTHLEGLFDSPFPQQGTGVVYTRTLNLDNLLPVERAYYTYLGSLTTPPCDEIVTWFVFRDAIPVSTEVIRTNQAIMAFTPGDECESIVSGECFPPREKTNYRAIQPLNGRSVFRVED